MGKGPAGEVWTGSPSSTSFLGGRTQDMKGLASQKGYSWDRAGRGEGAACRDG